MIGLLSVEELAKLYCQQQEEAQKLTGVFMFEIHLVAHYQLIKNRLPTIGQSVLTSRNCFPIWKPRVYQFQMLSLPYIWTKSIQWENLKKCFFLIFFV